MLALRTSYGGHVSTKPRRYSATFQDARRHPLVVFFVKTFSPRIFSLPWPGVIYVCVCARAALAVPGPGCQVCRPFSCRGRHRSMHHARQDSQDHLQDAHAGKFWRRQVTLLAVFVVGGGRGGGGGGDSTGAAHRIHMPVVSTSFSARTLHLCPS